MHPQERQEFLQKAKIVLGLATTIVLIILLLVYAVKVFLLVFAGMMVAIFFRGIARWISKKSNLPFKFSLPVAALLVVGIFAGLVFILQPKVSDQVDKLSRQIPQAAKKVQGQLQQSKTGRFILQQIPFDIGSASTPEASESQQNTSLQSDSSSSTEKTGTQSAGNSQQNSPPSQGTGSQPFQKAFRSFFSTTLGILGDLYVVFLLGLFFMANPEPYKKGIVALVPQQKRKRAREVVDASGITIRLWLFGKIISMLVVAVLSFIGLWALGVPLFVTLALIAGLLSFIPNFGPLLAIVPAFLVGYVQDPSLGFYVILLYIGVQTVESNLITPFIMKKQIQIPLAMTLFSQILLALLVGGLGLIFATPIIAVIMVMIQMIYIEDILGDKSIDVKGERLAKEEARG